MTTQLAERLASHPELKKHIERMLDIAENTTGTLKKADHAEMQIIDTIRQAGSALLNEWAVNQERRIAEEWKKEHPEAVGHGKKNCIGKPH